MPRSWSHRVQDMLDAIERIRDFTDHDDVDAAILWETAKQDVPALEAQLRGLLAEEE